MANDLPSYFDDDDDETQPARSLPGAPEPVKPSGVDKVPPPIRTNPAQRPLLVYDLDHPHREPSQLPHVSGAELHRHIFDKHPAPPKNTPPQNSPARRSLTLDHALPTPQKQGFSKGQVAILMVLTVIATVIFVCLTLAVLGSLMGTSPG